TVPSTGAAQESVPKNAVGMMFWICGVPGSASMVKVNAPSAIVPGINRLGMSLWRNSSAALRAGVEATAAGLPRSGLPVMVVHGVDDGLIPMDFSSRPYVEAVRAAGGAIAYWQVENAQHFDAFLALPDYGARY